jgi:AMMECR1 domain-containing protein
LLSVEERIEFTSEEELIKGVRPGLDGLTLEYGHHRATLLPQVWEQLHEARDFIAALKIKAGLAGDFWSADVIVSRYTVVTWKEPAPADVDPRR